MVRRVWEVTALLAVPGACAEHDKAEPRREPAERLRALSLSSPSAEGQARHSTSLT